MPSILTIDPNPPVWTSVLTTEINGLANTAGAVGSTVVDNSAGTPATGFQFELSLASLTPVGGGYVACFLLPENSDQSGTYIDSAEAIAAWQNYPHSIVSLEAVVGTQRQFSPVVWNMLLPKKYLAGIVSYAGVSLAASGNVLRVSRLNVKAV